MVFPVAQRSLGFVFNALRNPFVGRVPVAVLAPEALAALLSAPQARKRGLCDATAYEYPCFLRFELATLSQNIVFIKANPFQHSKICNSWLHRRPACAENKVFSLLPARRQYHKFGVFILPCIFLTVMEDRMLISDFLRNDGNHPDRRLEDGVESHYT